jgi:pimeloyl-ACP methyl ester carboxylesterase
MINKRTTFLTISIALFVSLLLTPGFKSLVNIANAQSSSCFNGVVMPTTPSNALPVILIHGFNEYSNIWSEWESLLKHDNIPYCTATFQSDDACGRAITHANELGSMIQKVKTLTHQNQVNIVGHSKGGLDARVFLDQSKTHDIANLIMIGTPNGGDPLADSIVLFNGVNIPNPFLKSFFCTPALFDLETFAQDTKAKENPFTKY